MPRLQPEDVACWVLKTSLPPEQVSPGWAPGTARELARCVRRSYRLQLVRPGQPCLLWLSGRDDPGVHAVGEITAGAHEDDDSGPAVAVRLTLLAEHVPRGALLAIPAARDAEVLRMPFGSNPSWLSPAQFAAVCALLPTAGLRGERPGRRWDDGSP